ncbi:MAG: hypothetical protein MZV70_69440 [Desulfobacterales bacterium]|nr:hypothetical protein [Desulfobacterales bacterium]
MRWKDAPSPDSPLRLGLPPDRGAPRTPPDGTGRFWFVLEADDWDALLGDRVLAYFQGAVFDSGPAAEAWVLALDAEARLQKKSGEPGVRYILRILQPATGGRPPDSLRARSGAGPGILHREGRSPDRGDPGLRGIPCLGNPVPGMVRRRNAVEQIVAFPHPDLREAGVAAAPPFTIPIAVMSYFILRGLQSYIDFAEQEVAGLRLGQPLLESLGAFLGMAGAVYPGT